MAQWLQQSTSITEKIGPFLDDSDGFTPETALTITQPDVRLSKNGGAFAQKAAAQTLTHDENGFYGLTLDATDTDTLGRLKGNIDKTGALPVFFDFMVVPTNVWESMFGADRLQVHTAEISASLITATTIATDAITAAKIATDAIDASALAADAVNEIVDAVWDEVLTGATHNIATSAGRRLRALQEFSVYALGAIWIDTVNGAAGTTDFENGTVTNPVNSIADANTLSASLGINRFVVASGSSLTFAASQENQEFLGKNWTLALGGQSISNSHFNGADVSGTGTSATEVHFDHCEIDNVTLGTAHLDQCDLVGTITLSAAATYYILGCYHAGTAVVDFGAAVASTTVHIHDYHGALSISNMGQSGTDILHFSSSNGNLTLNSNNIGGTVNLNGTFALTNNGSGQTLNRSGDVVDAVAGVDTLVTALNDLSAADVNAEVDTALSDISLDHLLFSALPTNFQTDVHDDSALGQMADNGSAVFDRTTDSLQVIADTTAPSAAVIADAVWDELTAGHLVANSFGVQCGTDIDAILVDTNELQSDDIPGDIAALNNLSAANINTEVADVINTDTSTEPAQGAPAVSASLRTKIDWLYKVMRNRKRQSATLWELYADNETTVDAKATISDDGTVAIKQEIETGP